MKPKVCITMGDFNGIGPEVVLKALRRRKVWDLCNPFVVGSLDVLEWYARRARIRCNLTETDGVPASFSRGKIYVMQAMKYFRPIITPGVLSRAAGEFAGRAVEMAAALALRKQADAIVTGPTSKQAMHRAGYRFPGQTEMLARLTHDTNVVMMLLAGSMRVGLASVHVPLRSVSLELTRARIIRKISTVHKSLRADFRILSPSIALLGLNPHAGEGGKLGLEEEKILVPAIRALRHRRMKVDGPFPADGFFGMHAYKKYDLVLAMYHDQGLIPLKMLGFRVGVNFSSGLRVVRTSPDHGTAFEIAGKWQADPESMVQAIALASRIAKNRR